MINREYTLPDDMDPMVEEDHLETELLVQKLASTIRIDKYLSEALPEYSRSYLKTLFDQGYVTVEGKKVKASFKVEEGQKILLHVPPLKEVSILPENIPLEILYEDEDVILVNKPKDMVVHPAPGHYSGTLVNALMYHCNDNLSGINGELRPGIVHRIDKDTTGVLLVCKNDKAHRKIANQLKNHSITRRYLALVHRVFKEESGTVNAPIGRHPYDRKKMAINPKNGKEAVTHYRVLKNFRIPNSEGYALVECELETGRTHQIRVHLSSIHHPLLGDEVYGCGKNPFHLNGQALHAGVLGFQHPADGRYIEVTAEEPTYFSDLVKRLDTMSKSL